MKKIIYSALALALLQMGATANASSHNFSNSDLKGAYGYSISGQFGIGLAATIVELGVFESDGVNSITAQGTTVINGDTVLNPSYDCSYTINPNGTGEAVCDRDDGVNPVVEGQTFKLVIDDSKKAVRIVPLPLADSPFEIVSVIGTGHKQ